VLLAAKVVVRADIARAALDQAPGDLDAWAVQMTCSSGLGVNIGGPAKELRCPDRDNA
jgi:hypothetical protein